MNIIFVENGVDVPVQARTGQTLLEVAHANEIELEGACDGSLACSTCHLILEDELYQSLDEPTGTRQQPGAAATRLAR